MSSLEDIKNRDRTIEELRSFIKKVMIEPGIIEQSLAITRELINSENAHTFLILYIRKCL